MPTKLLDLTITGRVRIRAECVVLQIWTAVTSYNDGAWGNLRNTNEACGFYREGFQGEEVAGAGQYSYLMVKIMAVRHQTLYYTFYVSKSYINYDNVMR